jgi:signal transduction histidine kinase
MTAGVAPGNPERRHRALRSALLTVFAAAWGALGWAAVWVVPAAEGQFLAHRAPAWLMWVDLGVGGVACAALWWRGRHGVVIAVAASALAPVLGSVSGAAAVAFVSVVANRRLVWLVPLTALNVGAGAVVLVMSLPQDSVFAVVLVAFSVLAGHAALIGLGLWLRARRQLVGSLRERAERAEAEREQALATARLEERTRIAREMHDVLAHRISLVGMHAGALEYRSDASGEDVRAAVGVIREHATLALQDLREVIGVLRDTAGVPDAAGDGQPPRPQPTLADLDGLVEEGRRAGTDVRLHTDVAQEPSATAGRTAYRVVQEGLTNARKHGGPGPVDVTVAARRGEEILVAVTSPLRDSREEALRPVPGSGSGLTGLAERVRLAGGRLEHGVVGASFRLRAWLPWEEASG